MSRNQNARRARLTVSELESRLTPAATATGPYAVGVPDGQSGPATVYNADGSVAVQVTPYGSDFTGGVRTALADVTGDGTADLITAPGPGTDPLVKVYDGVTHDQVASFDAYESNFTGGVYVAAADLNGDGKAEVVTGADLGGGPRVRVFDGASVASGADSPAVLDDFLGIADANFRGGVRIALGDVNGDGTADLVVGAGFGGGPRVTVYDGAQLGRGQQVKLVADFFAFENTLRNGVFPAVGDLNGDGCGDLIFGAGPGGSPRILALDGRQAMAGTETSLADFFAGNVADRSGVEVGTLPSSTSGSGTADSSTGTTSIVGVDLATHVPGLFDASGASQGTLSGPAAGRAGCIAAANGSDTGSTTTTGSSGSTSGSSAATVHPASVEGTYTGSGAGVLRAISASNTLGAGSSANVTVTVDITGATQDTTSTTTTDRHHRTPPGALAVTGTVTIAVDGESPLSESFTGTFVPFPSQSGGSGSSSSSGSTAAVQGRLVISSLGPASQAQPTDGFALAGTLSDGTLTVDGLAAFDHPGSGGGYDFRYPGSRDAGKLTLTVS